MNLKTQVSAPKNDINSLTLAERAELCCSLAKQLEKAGDYEAAYEAVAEFWPDRDKLPQFEGIAAPTKAELLLRAGTLAGWQSSAEQTEANQETAKNLITKSIEAFAELGNKVQAAEARGELALCYWREGSYDEARIHLEGALSDVGEQDPELRAVLLIRAAIVEADAERLDQSLRLYSEAIPVVNATQDHGLKGTFHNGYGVLLTRLATPENREEFLDRALIEYAAASFHFEQAGNDRYVARVENNLGHLYFTIGRYKEAHRHLDRARQIFLKLRDVGTAAQVDETRARTLIAEGHILEGERVVRSAVRVLERGGQQALLAEALATHGVALARLGNDARARALFERAIEIASTAGDAEGAGRVKLNIIEELGAKIPARDLVVIYRSANGLLKSSQDPSSIKRLISCADILIDILARLDKQDQESIEQSWEGFSFRQHAKASEKMIIERALRDAGGSVSKAAKLLGFKHHQSLISILNGRHNELLKMRTTARKRRKHIVDKPKQTRKRTRREGLPRNTSEVSILHVEDHVQIARLVGDILVAEDWRVESCSDGDTALRKLTGSDHYDVLIFDNDLPGISGLELVERARKITHRRRIPIIVLSGDDCEKAAWRAGANAFLRKPEGIDRLAATITRLLRDESGRE